MPETTRRSPTPWLLPGLGASAWAFAAGGLWLGPAGTTGPELGFESAGLLAWWHGLLALLGGLAVLSLLPAGEPSGRSPLQRLHALGFAALLATAFQGAWVYLGAGLWLGVLLWPRLMGPRGLIPRHPTEIDPSDRRRLRWVWIAFAATSGVIGVALVRGTHSDPKSLPAALLGWLALAGILDHGLAGLRTAPWARAGALALAGLSLSWSTPSLWWLALGAALIGWQRRADQRGLWLAAALVAAVPNLGLAAAMAAVLIFIELPRWRRALPLALGALGIAAIQAFAAGGGSLNLGARAPAFPAPGFPGAGLEFQAPAAFAAALAGMLVCLWLSGSWQLWTRRRAANQTLDRQSLATLLWITLASVLLAATPETERPLDRLVPLFATNACLWLCAAFMTAPRELSASGEQGPGW